MKARAVLLLFLLRELSPSAVARASTNITLQAAPGGLQTVHASVAGHDGTFLFDSGSGVSNITPQFATSIGCRPWGQISGFRMTGQRLDMKRCDDVAFTLAGRAFPAQTVGVFDIVKFLPEGIGPIDGTISLDLFAADALSLSLAGQSLHLLDSASLAQTTKGLRALPLHIVRDAEGLALTVDLPVRTSGGTAWFELDSGNTSGCVLIGKHLADLFGLKPDSDDSDKTAVTLVDGTIFTGRVRVLDLILDGNLGATFLLKYDVTLDLEHKRAWVAPYILPVPWQTQGTHSKRKSL